MAQFLTSKTLNYNLCELVKQEALRCIADRAISVCCFPFVDSIQEMTYKQQQNGMKQPYGGNEKKRV